MLAERLRPKLIRNKCFTDMQLDLKQSVYSIIQFRNSCIEEVYMFRIVSS